MEHPATDKNQSQRTTLERCYALHQIHKLELSITFVRIIPEITRPMEANLTNIKFQQRLLMIIKFHNIIYQSLETLYHRQKNAH